MSVGPGLRLRRASSGLLTRFGYVSVHSKGGVCTAPLEFPGLWIAARQLEVAATSKLSQKRRQGGKTKAEPGRRQSRVASDVRARR